MEYPDKKNLLNQLKVFMEIHGKTKILEANEGVLRMHVLHSKNQNKSIKEKMINYKLLRVDERLLNPEKEISEKDSVIVEFLISELMKYYSVSKKK